MAEILVGPQSAPLDTTLAIRVVDLPPDELVTVRASTGDRAASAVFRADDRGVVDLARHAPLAGSYTRVDPMGLFWSMTPTGGERGETVVEVEGVLVEGSGAGGSEAGRSEAESFGKVRLERLAVPEHVKRTEVDEDGLVGVLFTPDDGDTHPGVVLLGGSEGGLHELDAALLAGHGFTVLAQAYFGAPGVQADLVEVPLELIGRGVELLGERAGRIGVVGGSRGGELALLAGATFPDVEAVVSVVGSGVVTQCIGPGARLLQKLEHEAAPWTYQGRPIPYLPYSVPHELRMKVVAGEPVPLRWAFDLTDGIPEECQIPVERIAGGVLLLSSGQDESWPSVQLSEVAERRLIEHDHPFRYEHVVYQEAGHLIAGPPHLPTTDVVVPGPGVRFSMGGAPAATAAARADAWRRTVEFLSDQLGT